MRYDYFVVGVCMLWFLSSSFLVPRCRFTNSCGESARNSADAEAGRSGDKAVCIPPQMSHGESAWHTHPHFYFYYLVVFSWDGYFFCPNFFFFAVKETGCPYNFLHEIVSHFTPDP